MTEVLSLRYSLSTIREFRTVAVERGQSISSLLKDAVEYARTYHAVPGECTSGSAPTMVVFAEPVTPAPKLRQGARKAELRRRGMR